MKKNPFLLVVEDSKKTQQVIRDRFTELGCDLVSCETAEEAMQLLQTDSRVDVIILDFNLPGMKGPAFYEHVTKDKVFSIIPVVPFTSTVDKEYNSKSTEPGDWALISTAHGGRDNSTPIVSKGDSEHISHVPDKLIINVGRAIRKKGVPIPDPMREVITSITRKIGKGD